MRFIEGIGYIDDNGISIAGRTGATKTQTESFDNILSVETDKLNSSDESMSLDDIFTEASDKYGISRDLLKAIAYTESGYNADATSSSGAMGIMQLMPSTAKAMGVDDAYDPYQNIMGGAKLISTLSDMYNGNQTLIIAAYNAGSGNVAKYGGVPPFTETQNYVSKVLSALESGVAEDSRTSNNITDSQSQYGVSASSKASSYSSDYISNIISDNTEKESSLSYQEYQLLMTYFDTMMSIISDMGSDNSSDSSSESDDSLSDLFKLGSQITYNKNTIDL